MQEKVVTTLKSVAIVVAGVLIANMIHEKFLAMTVAKPAGA